MVRDEMATTKKEVAMASFKVPSQHSSVRTGKP
jgi:hypothetical protein